MVLQSTRVALSRRGFRRQHIPRGIGVNMRCHCVKKSTDDVGTLGSVVVAVSQGRQGFPGFVHLGGGEDDEATMENYKELLIGYGTLRWGRRTGNPSQLDDVTRT